jgi:hypothetical protein
MSEVDARAGLLREKRDGVLRREVGELSNVGEVRNL